MQSLDEVQPEVTPHEDEDIGLIGLDVEQVVAVKSRNTMLLAEENRSFCDAETFDIIAHLRIIKLIPKLSCILKLKIFQMNVKITFLNRYLMVDVYQVVRSMSLTTNVSSRRMILWKSVWMLILISTT